MCVLCVRAVNTNNAVCAFLCVCPSGSVYAFLWQLELGDRAPRDYCSEMALVTGPLSGVGVVDKERVMICGRICGHAGT